MQLEVKQIIQRIAWKFASYSTANWKRIKKVVLKACIQILNNFSLCIVELCYKYDRTENQKIGNKFLTAFTQINKWCKNCLKNQRPSG